VADQYFSQLWQGPPRLRCGKVVHQRALMKETGMSHSNQYNTGTIEVEASRRRDETKLR